MKKTAVFLLVILLSFALSITASAAESGTTDDGSVSWRLEGDRLVSSGTVPQLEEPEDTVRSVVIEPGTKPIHRTKPESTRSALPF